MVVDYRKTRLKLNDEIWLTSEKRSIPVKEAIQHYTELIDSMRDTDLIKLDGDALGYLIRRRNEKSDNPTGDTEPIKGKDIINSLFDKLGRNATK